MDRGVIKRTLILFVVVIASASCAKLNVARILLPIFKDYSVNFTILSTEEACLKWSLSRGDVVTLKQLDYNSALDCSDKAIVSTLLKEPNRVSAEITVEDVETKQQLRCIAMVDAIHSLSIITKSRELTLDEAPVIFEVRAYDIQGNEFSSLDGVPFKWTISSLGSQKDNPVVRIASFADSPYNSEFPILDLENRGLSGNIILLEGVRTGMAKISVQLDQPEYAKVGPCEVILNVLNNVIIYPVNVFMMIDDDATLTVMQSSFGKYEHLKLDDSNYYFQVENPKILSVGDAVGTFVATAYGSTKVFLRDKTLDNDIGDDQDGNQYRLTFPTANFHVVQPFYMLLALKPYNNWATVVNARHIITAQIYTEDDKKVTLGSKYTVQTTIGEDFRVLDRTKNGTFINGYALKIGNAPIKATLDAIKPLNANAEIVIFPRITIVPAEVILPWDSVTKPQYDVYLKASGGDGKFLWTSTNHSIGLVTQYGRVHTLSDGFFQVAANMHRNHHNRQVSNFYIVPPNKLEIIEQSMDAEVGNPIFLHVALYVEKFNPKTKVRTYNVPVTLCQGQNFKTRITNPYVLVNDTLSENPVGSACGTIALISSEEGTTKVTVSYSVGSKILEDSVTIAFHKPMKLFKPVIEPPLVLAVGSSTNLIFSGGMSPNDKGSYKLQIETSTTDHLNVVEMTSCRNLLPKDDDYSVVTVTCLKLGESKIFIKICNKDTLPNCKDSKGSYSATVVCGKPRKLELQPEIKVADVGACPMDLNAEKIIVQNNQDVDLLVKLFDDKGREFLNFSSLEFRFESVPTGQVAFESENTVLEKVGLVGNVQFSNKSYQRLTPKLEVGEVDIRVAVLGYRDDVLRANRITPESPNFVDEGDTIFPIKDINAKISLMLVEDTVMTPNQLSLYNHPKNVIKVDVQQGSGYYSISMNKEDVVSVKYLEFVRQLEITPIADGDVLIKLTDLCLNNRPAVIDVNVMSIASIKAEMTDKVEIGKCITSTVRLLDANGNSLDVPNSEFIRVKHQVDKKIVTIENAGSASKEELQYIVTGSDLGDAKIIFYIGEPGQKDYVASTPMNLQVFPPLKFSPRQMTLMIGAEMQFVSRGGPQPLNDLQFTAEDTEIAKVASNGLVAGIDVGITKVHVKALGSLPNGQKTIYGEDSVEVNVVALTGIKIEASLTRFKVGSTIPLRATGVPEVITPLILGTVHPSIMFSWGVQEPHIARLFDVIYGNKIEFPNVNLLSVRLKGLSPGKTVVYLNATVTVKGRSVMYTSHIDVDIIDPLMLISPLEVKTNTVFMATHSTTQLKTNLDALGEVSYKLLGHEISSTEVQTSQKSNVGALVVSPTGLVHSFGMLGTSTIIATAVDDTGAKQSLIIPIEVKPVHCMMVKVKSSWRLNSPSFSMHIPLGTLFELEAKFFDRIGNSLVGSGPELFSRVSRHDLISIQRTDNNTFTVVTKKPGVTVLKLANSDSIVDYIKLNATQLIKPQEIKLTVGDVVCYHTPVIMLNEPGFWSSPDCTIMVVDKAKGIAMALKPGNSAILHSYHSYAPLHIDIQPIKELRLNDYDVTFNNAQEYKLYVNLIGPNTKRNNNLISGWDCSLTLRSTVLPSPITCSLLFTKEQIKKEYFSVAAKFDDQLGKHYCSIRYSKPGAQITLPSSEADLTISAENVEPQVAKLKFVPGIEVPDKVHMQEGSMTGSLSISGSADALSTLTVRPVDDKIASVGDRTQDGNTVTFTVQLNSFEQDSESYKNAIEVKATASNQHKLLDIQLDNVERLGAICLATSGPQTIMSFLQSNRQSLSIIFAIIITVVTSTYVYVNCLQPAQQPVNVNVCTTHTQALSSTPPMNRSFGPLNTSANLNGSFGSTPLDYSTFDQSCSCSKSPEIRRNRRYL